MSSKTVLLVDGTCIFCNRLVAFIMNHRAGQDFHFAHIQGRTAQDLLTRHGLVADIDTIYAVTDFGAARERVWIDGEASRQIWPRLYQFAAIIRYVPLFWLNFNYRFFASIRYRLFGQARTCIAPSQEQRHRFLA